MFLYKHIYEIYVCNLLRFLHTFYIKSTHLSYTLFPMTIIIIIIIIITERLLNWHIISFFCFKRKKISCNNKF